MSGHRKATPRPWRLTVGGDVKGWHVGKDGATVILGQRDGIECESSIAVVCTNWESEEGEANGELIVRAVNAHGDLLFELKNLYAMVQGEVPSLLEDDHQDGTILAAIAKAERPTA